MTPLTIYFDLDGVLADMGKAISDFTGKAASTSAQEHAGYLARRKSMSLYDGFRLLEPNTRMNEVMRKLHAAGHTLETLTSYGILDSMEMGSEVHRGKADFMRQHYGTEFLDGVLSRFNGVSKGSQKQYYAGPQTLLIDDWGKNIEQFRAAGGLAVHYAWDRHDECVQELYELTGVPT
jgi:hypothetical protein